MLQTLIHTLLRALLAVGALFLLLASVVIGLVLAAALVIWALLRGRRPANIRFRWHGARRPVPGQAGSAFGHRPTGDVVDVEARELPDVPPRELRDR